MFSVLAAVAAGHSTSSTFLINVAGASSSTRTTQWDGKGTTLRYSIRCTLNLMSWPGHTAWNFRKVHTNLVLDMPIARIMARWCCTFKLQCGCVPTWTCRTYWNRCAQISLPISQLFKQQWQGYKLRALKSRSDIQWWNRLTGWEMKHEFVIRSKMRKAVCIHISFPCAWHSFTTPTCPRCAIKVMLLSTWQRSVGTWRRRMKCYQIRGFGSHSPNSAQLWSFTSRRCRRRIALKLKNQCTYLHA